MLSFRSIDIFNSDLLESYTVVWGYIIPTFRRNVLSSTCRFLVALLHRSHLVTYIHMVENG
jgi:hypothetical protein